jgi:uncharacterized repeat protein (TIGR03803 family)
LRDLLGLTVHAQTNCADGYLLQSPLVQGADGSFYGMTGYGGATGAGTVFKITPEGAFTTLANFASTNGSGYTFGAMKPPTASSTEQPPGAGPTAMARSSK